MQINLINQYHNNRGNSTLNLQNPKSSMSFKGLSKNLAEKVNLATVSERLKGIEGVRREAFEQIASCAEEVAKNGNDKPKILVEIMVRFISGVENLNKNGETFAESCHKMARKLYREFAVNQSKQDGFQYPWEYLAKVCSKGQESWIKRITPSMEPTKMPIAFSYNDLRDMFEFLRKNWKQGNAAYRNVMHGRGLKGWVSYISEECFPNYYDKFYRKH